MIGRSQVDSSSIPTSLFPSWPSLPLALRWNSDSMLVYSYHSHITGTWSSYFIACTFSYSYHTGTGALQPICDWNPNNVYPQVFGRSVFKPGHQIAFLLLLIAFFFALTLAVPKVLLWYFDWPTWPTWHHPCLAIVDKQTRLITKCLSLACWLSNKVTTREACVAYLKTFFWTF